MNALPLNGRVVIVDDQIEQALPIMNELGKRGIKHIKVVYSKEMPHQANENEQLKRTPASISFVPSVAGLILAGEVIKDLI